MESRSFKKYVEQKFGRIPQFFIYAVLELTVIILLLIDGLIAFAVNQFAFFFELEIPCLLCTRIDHVLFRKNSDSHYNESFCEDHKKHVSSLAYCNIHKKLSDVRFICEGCLLSFASENKSNSETYKSLVGILGSNLECSVEDDHKIHLRLPAGEKNAKGSVQIEKSSMHLCSCCREPRKVRTSLSQALVQNPVLHNEVGFPKVPMITPRVSATAVNGECKTSDPLPHVQYSELSYVSDVESEIHDEVNAVISLESQGKEDTKAASVPLIPDCEDLNEDSVCKTPSCIRTNRFYGGFTDSATASPRWSLRHPRGSSGEKAESGTESVEGNSASETEGDTILLHLKRQVRLDRKTLIAMYMELDEERSASAVAANQAMAMITRLQAEKAAVQMEALQYQRMMEEQAEYDQEALQVLKELLNRREDEIKILEAELKAYRERHGCEEEMYDDHYQKSSFRCNSFANSDDGSTFANIEAEDDEEGKCISVQLEPLQVQPETPKVQSKPPRAQPGTPKTQPKSVQVQPETPKVQPKSPLVQTETPKMESMPPPVQPETPKVQPETPKVESKPPPVQPETPKVQPETPKMESMTPPVQPETPKVQPETPKVESKPPPVQPETPKVQWKSPPVQPETPKVQSKPPQVQPEPPQVQPEQPQVHHKWIKVDESLIDFEGERLYLMDHLRILERKIRCTPSDGVFTRLQSSDLTNLKEECRGEGNSTNFKITREISHFYEKLLALETDREFLKHAFLSLHKGDEGTKLLREVVQHLRYLRHMPLEG